MLGLSKRILIVFGITLILVIILFITVFGNRPVNITPTPSPALKSNPFMNMPVDDQTTIKTPDVLEITPKEGVILNPGDKLKITIKFNQSINLGSLNINLKASDVGGDGVYQVLDFEQELLESNTVLSITADELIKSFYNYNLTLFSNEGQKLLQITWVSDRTEIKKEVENNPELQQYLPYSAFNFTLSFVPEKNLYVFSFNYDDKSSESIDNQFNRAQSEALEFIRSKGIDPDSLKIEWRYH